MLDKSSNITLLVTLQDLLFAVWVLLASRYSSETKTTLKSCTFRVIPIIFCIVRMYTFTSCNNKPSELENENFLDKSSVFMFSWFYCLLKVQNRNTSSLKFCNAILIDRILNFHWNFFNFDFRFLHWMGYCASWQPNVWNEEILWVGGWFGTKKYLVGL